jgi:hypothetical protein
MSGLYSYPDFPGASYDHWKTTPPDSWDEPDELTPEQEAEDWFDEWQGEWYHARFDGGYEASLDAQAGTL